MSGAFDWPVVAEAPRAACLGIGVGAAPLLVYGSRSYAQTVADLARDCGYDVLGMIDDHERGPGIVGSLEEAQAAFAARGHSVALGIGYRDLAARWAAWQRLRATGWRMPALVHPRAYVAGSARLSAGCVVMAGATIDRQAVLGEAVVAWPGACISHDVTIGENAFISPNATLCGFARVGAHSFIGAAAAVADHCVVPQASFLKMGSVYSKRAR